jgi:hypothetical protein
MISFEPFIGGNITRDVTTDPVTGKPHKVKALRGIQFDDDPPIETPGVCLDVRLSVIDGVKRAVFIDRDSDMVYHVYSNGGILDMFAPARAMGRYAAAFDAQGNHYIQRDNSRPDYDAFGIHHIEPDGRWVMNGDPSLNHRVPSGDEWIELIQCDVQGAYIAGKCDRATNSGVARGRVDGELEHFAQYTQFA